jgi:putative ABC transport system permease protein
VAGACKSLSHPRLTLSRFTIYESRITNHDKKTMLRNYLKIAIRNILKQKFHALVNVMGLAIGVACCLLIMLYVRDELSYDTFPERSDRIYRVATEIKFGGNHTFYAVAPAPMAAGLVNDFPEVEESFRFRERGSVLVRRDDDIVTFKEERRAYADPNFFQFFSVKVLSGDPKTALLEPNSLAISASTAEKYFKNEDPVGKSLIFDERDKFKVTAVYEDLPSNAHFHFDLLMAMEGYADSKDQSWLSNNYHTYLALKEGADSKALEAKFPALFEKYGGPQIMQILNVPLSEIEKNGQGVWYSLQPLRDIHLRSNLTVELEPNGDISYVYIFSSIALFILLIACINFMNLSTARSANRAREVGVRKVLGSFRSDLIRQFLVESMLITAGSFVLAIILVEALLPGFNNLIGKELEVPYHSPVFTGAMILGMMLVGLASGTYPAFFLSSFKPVEVLKGKLRTGMGNLSLRNGLVVFQFIISIFLIVGTLVIHRQLEFIRGKNLGFEKEQVLLLHDAYALGNQLQTFKEQAENLPQVKKAAISSYLPVSGSSRSDLVMWREGQLSEANSVSMQFWNVDHDYVETLGMKVLQGRNFSKEFPTDSTGIVLNESAARLFGFDDPVGKRVSTFTGPPEEGVDNIETYTILGVVEDFHFESLREKVDALGMILGRSSDYMALRYEAENTGDLIKSIETLWNETAPGRPFAYSFLDDRFERMYDSDQRTGRIFFLFAGLAIFIACLGLFALASFTTERRTKEIGVRKVLGASTGKIFLLLSSEFSKWVLVACALALPLAWYGANRWLQDFQYQTRIDPWIFLVAGLIAFTIALLAVSFQSIKAASSNPVKALKYE